MRTGGTLLLSACTAVLLLTAACAPGEPGTPQRQGQPGAPARLLITPAHGARKVAPDTGISVKVTDGQVTGVIVTDADGRQISGGAGADGTWRPQWPLKPSTAYTVRVRAVGTDGRQVTERATFTTLKPARVLDSGLSPVDGERVGVGMPIQLILTKPVAAREDRAAVERALTVEMSKPVEGSWSWVSDREVQYRPRSYWPSGEEVTVVAHLAGLRVGRGTWGVKDRRVTFTVGAEHITKIRNGTHRAVVRKNGKVVRTIPISLGKPGFESWSGTMIAQEKAPDILMDSATIGLPGLYRTRTKWNIRMTYSGMFFHAAPWSVGDQGHRNVSHGCVNASTSHAHWFYNFTQRGDIIKIVGTKHKLQFGNGPTPWTKTWDQWRAGSALYTPDAPATPAAPDDSHRPSDA
ncbi:L,D-transpeptidase [Nonomuraea wenchangensis]|uniref:Lipoprotein-anchoring transpeptidase ErfK/SrfK n=1 Tax=Nonomuraea wenchangensis TaxID=568860 RepID=A0A1I0KHT0_9ACTN|nr:Ig-like domain-containing protein [Nonomuraea wenchangensis]SEU24131.1 Lipoprotein-anchoring transpeptidase ErfK/SrfK [Nonomuraea wenchangensis]